MERNWNKKDEQLKKFTQNNDGEEMASNEGTKISNDENTLKAGERGPTLHEDFLFQEKLAHFDRERIPERVVHARGYGAHGEFRVYKSLAHLTKAPSCKTQTRLHLYSCASHRWQVQGAPTRPIEMYGDLRQSSIPRKETSTSSETTFLFSLFKIALSFRT